MSVADWSRAQAPISWMVIALVFGSVLAGSVVLAPAAALLLIVGLLAGLMSAYAPGVLFAAYLLVPPFYKGALQAYSPIDITVLLAVLNVLQFVPLLLEKRPRRVSRFGVTLWIALAVMILAGVLYAPDQDFALGKAASWWALVFLPIIPAALRVGSRSRYLRQFLWAVFALGVPMVIAGLGELSSTQRLAPLGANTIEVGRAALLVPLLGVVFVIQQRSLVMRCIGLALIPPALLVAIASGSRGPIVALFLVGAIAAVAYLPRMRAVHFRFLGVIASLIVLSAMTLAVAGSSISGLSLERFSLLGDFVQGVMGGQLDTAIGDTSSGTRVQLFGLAVSLFEEHPVLGVGTDGFEVLSPLNLGPIEGESYPHNAVLQIAADLGLVGLLIVLGLVLLALRRRLLEDKESRAVRLTLLFFLLCDMVSRGVYEDRPTWGLIMLVVLIEGPQAVSRRQRPALSVASPSTSVAADDQVSGSYG